MSLPLTDSPHGDFSHSASVHSWSVAFSLASFFHILNLSITQWHYALFPLAGFLSRLCQHLKDRMLFFNPHSPPSDEKADIKPRRGPAPVDQQLQMQFTFGHKSASCFK